MNREVEERIVAMYFDNQDFEKNAKTTIETLGQLKEGLNLEDTAQKGFSIFEKIGKSLDFTKANQGLQKMKTTMSSMGNIFKKIFSLGPIDDAFRALDNFKNKYFDRVIGFDIANKLVSSMESIFRQLTVQPISAGWDQYQAKMDSVKTIMTSTGESIDVVNAKLEDMTQYANKTIYSLTDMTSNLGKFTNNGVKLDDAVQAMEGIANATAHAGQGSQAASMAMYNISQAMGVGKMTTVDWKSLENANVATMQLKNTFLEVAAAAGKIKKEVVKTGDTTRTVFKLTTDENGKKLKKEIELTAENFREYLSKGWLDKETMLRTFQIYSGQGIDENTLKSWGITDPELIKKMYELGEEAMEAATQVRTAGKMLDALKESVQSGWADSFEIIFGNMEEGTQLWTKMNEKIDAVLSASTQRRNNILKKWAEMTEDGQKYWTTDDKGNKVRTGIEGGREILLDTFFELMEVAKTVGSTISDAFSKVFGKLDAKKLFDLTIGFRNLVNGIKTWLGSTKDANSRISKLQKGLQGVFSIIKVGINFVKMIVNLAKRLFGPILDWAVGAFAAVGKFFDGLGDMRPAYLFKALGNRLKNVWKDITNFFKKENGQEKSPFETWVKNLWDGFKKIVKDWAHDVGLDGVIEAISGAWNTIVGWEGWTDIGKFFSDIWTWIADKAGVVINWFTPGKNGEDSGFVKFIKEVAGGISGIWTTVTGWEGWTTIGKFFSDIWGWIAEKAGVVINWFTPGEKGEDSGFVKFVKEVAGGISSVWNTITGWEGWTAIGNFFSDIWAWIADKAGVVINWFTLNEEDPRETGWIKFVDDVYTTICDVWKSVTEWEGWEKVGQFFSDIWAWIADQAGVVINWFTYSENGEDSGFVKFLKGIKTAVESAWEEIVGWEGWKEIGQFFSDVWGWIMDLFSGGEETAEDDSTEEAAHKGIKRKAGVLQKFRDAAREHLKQVRGLTEDMGEVGTDTDGMEKKASIFQTIITTITDFITKVVDAVRGWVITPEVSQFLTNMKDFFGGLMVALGDFFESLGRLLKGESKWFDNNPDFWNVALPGIILALIEGFNLIKLHLMGNVTTASVGQQFLQIAGSIFLLASGISILVSIDKNMVWEAVKIVGVLGAIVGVIVGIVAYITKLKTAVADKPVTSTERVLTTLINTLGKIGLLWVAMEELPKIIESIGKVKKDLGENSDGLGSDILNTFLGLSALIATIGVVMTIITKIAPTGIPVAAAVSSAFSIMAVVAVVVTSFEAILGLIGGISDMIGGQQGTDKVCDIIDQGGQILNHIGLALSGFVTGLLGIKTQEQKAAESLGILDMLGDSLQMFDTEKVSGISRLMTLLTQITSDYNAFDSSKLAGFSTAVGEVGRAVYEFVRYLNVEGTTDALKDLHDPTTEVYQRLLGFTEVGKRLGDMLHAFGGASSEYGLNATLGRLTEIAKPENLEQLVNSLNAIMSGLGTLDRPEDGIQFDGLSIVQRLYEAIQQGLNDPHLPPFDAESIVQAIVNALLVGKDAIAFLVHEMVQEGLKLSNEQEGAGSFELSDDNVEWLKNFMNGDATSGVAGVIDNFDESQITGIVDQLSDKIPSLQSMFEGKGWMDFKDENGNEIDILSELQGHLTELGTTLDTMEPLKVTITPVVDFSQITPEKLQEQLNGKPVELNSIFNLPAEGLKIDFTGLDTALDMASVLLKLQGIIDQLNSSAISLGEDIDALGGHMDSIAAEVAGLQLVLDTGELVGRITPMVDREMANLELVYERQ